MASLKEAPNQVLSFRSPALAPLTHAHVTHMHSPVGWAKLQAINKRGTTTFGEFPIPQH